MHRDTTFIYLKLGVRPIFWVRITCFSLSLSGFFYAGASKTQEDTLQVFIIKIEM